MSLKERYRVKAAEVEALERQIAETEAAGDPVPARLRFGLERARVKAEELRTWGHREHVREIREGMLEAARGELEALDSRPVPTSEEIRRKREALGARQRDLAMFAGVSLASVVRAEGGAPCHARTLRKIAAGLEDMTPRGKTS
jgi:hypothetical protein